MNTLSFPQFQKRIISSPRVAEICKAFQNRAGTGAAQGPLEIETCEGAFSAILIAHLHNIQNGKTLIITATDNEAALLAQDLETLGLKPELFPWWGTIPYREIPSHSAVFSQRANILSKISADMTAGHAEKALSKAANIEKPIIIAHQRAFLNFLSPPDYINGLLVKIKTGESIDFTKLAHTLALYGYTRVPRVQVQGEFALRGEVLDILQGGENDAHRILLDFDRIESIRPFDPIDQSTLGGRKPLSELLIRPLKEVIWTDDRIEALSKNLENMDEFIDEFKSSEKASQKKISFILEELMANKNIAGEEMFFSLAFEKPALLSDYLGSEDTVFFLDRERLDNAQEVLEREYKSLYNKSLKENTGHLLLPAPHRLLADFSLEVNKIKNRISFMALKGKTEEGVTRFSAGCEPARSFFGNIDYLRDEFASLLKQGWDLVVAAESEVQASRLVELLRDDKVFISSLPFSSGFSMPEIKFMLIQENEIFGRRQRPPKSLKTVRSAAIDTFVELNPGDYVVHINYGIGHFKGIERIRALGNERDYIKLEYLSDETVFVPIEQVNLIQRYIGSEGNPPRLDKLGSKNWENRKNRVKQSVEDIAEKLLVIYSRRKQSQGYAFPKDTEWQTMFEAAFPFEETEDQLRCVDEIKADMESPHPMDRLICGDVGYGKTEVAVRACFKAIMGGRQAAFLAPTTILAEQHHENFKERFRQFPVRLAMLSRFVEEKQVRKILEDVKNGNIDLLIGTHRIIQKDVIFKNLGLIVIDEEQRFGVKDKERLKELKANVDCLTLSATPIPRTLHMSLLKIRDMSLLATPPENRLPIDTAIHETDDEKIAAAIRSEMERGGQVFYLHNRIQDLRETRIKLERLIPEMTIDIAHGQMDGRDLEDVMHRFVHGGFHVLLSTTIIENGIDIPNVNTIIIDRADMYGVSQLYQLRGRVGRSDRVAYAYLFYPKDKALTEVAMKRLQVISDFTELGSGFKIAMKDMEIRGAGNLLGREQSGDIYSVGFDLYLRLLDEAVMRLENEDYEAEIETLMELEYTGFIPDTYIDTAQEKMEVYKKIASIRTREELERIYSEMLDRFGPLPDEAASLLSLAELRIICRELAISSLKEKNNMLHAEFSKVSKVKADRLVRMMMDSGGRIKLDPKQPNVVIFSAGNIGLKEKSEFIREKLAVLAG